LATMRCCSGKQGMLFTLPVHLGLCGAGDLFQESIEYLESKTPQMRHLDGLT
jgi:hypothetical protein